MISEPNNENTRETQRENEAGNGSAQSGAGSSSGSHVQSSGNGQSHNTQQQNQPAATEQNRSSATINQVHPEQQLQESNAAVSHGSSGESDKVEHGALDNAKGNVGETGEKIGKAKETVKAFLNGDANIVDAAMAVKGAVDAVKGLSGKISESLMMPVMKALMPFKGQAILPAAKQMDPVMGVDVHMVTIPPAMGVPVPMPHPYIGMLFNSKDFISCAINTFKKAALDALPAPAEGDNSVMASVANNKDAIAGIAMGIAGMSASVKFGDFIPRAVTGTPCKNIPHIPMGAGFHPGFSAAVAKNVGKAFLGSLFVVADGDPMVGSFHLNYDCWDVGVVDLFKTQRKGGKHAPPSVQTELFVPSGVVTPIPIGRPVLVNSIPTPINPMAILDKLFKAGLGKLAKVARKVAQAGLNKLNGKVGCGPLTAASKLVGTGQSHPVDVSSGHFYTDNVDFSLPGPIPFSFERTWYSYSNYNGPLGYGWHHNYDMALAIDVMEQVAIVRLADGRVAHLPIPLVNEEVYNRSEKLTLSLHQEGYYFVTDKKGLIYRFTQNIYKNPYNNTETFLLQSIANRNGFAIRFTYNNKSLLTQIVDSAGRELKVNNDLYGRIISIEAPDPGFQGRGSFPITSFRYSDEGDMISQANALQQAITYEYVNHLMVREVWRNGCVWQLRYDKASGIDAKCIEVTGTGNLLHYKFDYTNPLCTLVINSRGYKKQFYHKNGVVTKHIDALGAVWEYHYNQFNELEWETDPLGNQKATTYDDWGNVATVTEANGAFLQVNYGGGFLKHVPVSSVDKAGGKWKWEYDEAGNLVKRTNPIKAVTAYEYEDGLLKKIVNAKGVSTQLEYDNLYNLAKMMAANGYEMYWQYDVLGNCIRSADSMGNSRRIKFNLASLPVEINEPDGNTRLLEFDAEANVIRARDKHYDIKFAYDPLNNLISRIEAGRGVGYRYDTEGNLIQLTNEHNEVYSFEIDAADRVIKEIGFDGITRLYTRNEAGKVTRVDRPGNKFTAYKYDEVGNITSVDYHDDSSETYAYSKAGLLLKARNNNSSIAFERDILGRIVREIGDDQYVENQFDILGNRIHIGSSLGADISNEFDDLGNVSVTNAMGWESRNRFNELGLEVERLLPGNIVCQWQRDKLGRPTRQQIKGGSSYVHNRQYSWDVNYRLQRIADSQSGVTEFFHDEVGNLAKTIFSDGTQQWRNPDAVGNLFSSPDRKDRTYGKGGKLLRANGTSYQYDDEGNLVEKREASGKIWKYQWNASGMLQSVARPDGAVVSFTYDALGRRLSKRYKSTVTRWIWDGNKPLHEWKEHAITGMKLSNSSVNQDGLITWLFNENSFAPVGKIKGNKSYSVITDHLGTPFQMFANNGEMIWEGQLDSYGKLKMNRGEEGSCPFRYQGQYEDAETGLYYNRFRYYDAEEGVYISQDPIRLRGGKKIYSYVIDVNIWVDIFGLSEIPCLGRGNTGRTEAQSLEEHLAMEEIKSNPELGSPLPLRKGMTDSRWDQKDGWVKMSNTNAHGVEIHYVAQFDQDGKMTAVDDFKFK